MALLSNLQKSFETFVVVMSKRQLAEYVNSVISKLPPLREISEDVARNRMEFIREVVNSDLFTDDGKEILIMSSTITSLSQTFWLTLIGLRFCGVQNLEALSCHCAWPRFVIVWYKKHSFSWWQTRWETYLTNCFNLNRYWIKI